MNRYSLYFIQKYKAPWHSWFLEPEKDIFTIERYEEIVQDIPLELRDYQKEAVAYAAHNQKCILVSPTASGKSLMIYSLIRYNFLKKNGKALVIVPTTSLVEQLWKSSKIK